MTRRRLGAGDRARDPRPAEDARRRCSAAARTASARRRTRRPARCAWRSRARCPVPNRRGDRGDDQARARARLRDRRARGLPPQELLLSRPAEGVPDQPVRRAAVRAAAGWRVPLEPTATSTIGIVRAHLEEDAAKTTHVARVRAASTARPRRSSTSTAAARRSSRSSPQPDLHDADTAKRFLQLLRQTVVELGISDAELEKGSMRFDVNVSVRPRGSDELRTRTELKNMNSFAFAAKGIEREIARQIRIYEAGGDVEQETLHFDPAHEESPPLRSQGGGAGLPLLPGARPRPGAAAGRARRAPARRDRGAAGRADPAPRRRRCRSTTPTCSSPAGSTALVGRSSRPAPTQGSRERARRTSSSRPASTRPRVDAGRAGEARVRARRDPAGGLRRGARARRRRRASTAEPHLAQKVVSDASELDPVIERVIAANPGQAEQYRGGKQGLLGFFVGQVMKETGGSADPRVVNERVREKLG